MDKFIILQWPESQTLFGRTGFEENAFLILDKNGVYKYGSSAYFVNEKWLKQE